MKYIFNEYKEIIVTVCMILIINLLNQFQTTKSSNFFFLAHEVLARRSSKYTIIKRI